MLKVGKIFNYDRTIRHYGVWDTERSEFIIPAYFKLSKEQAKAIIKVIKNKGGKYND